MRKIISLICILLPILAYADDLVVRESAPNSYVVVKGDTLWDISNKFFKDPWKWPQIWGFNKDTIKDPHWIYPGNVVVLDHATNTLRFGEEVKSGPSSNQTALVSNVPPNTESNTNKLSPKIRVIEGSEAISSIPANVIAPFLNKPVVIESEAIDGAPTIIGSIENRTLLSFGDTAFAIDVPPNKGHSWQLYRPGKALIDPDTDEVLGYEAIYLGDASVNKFDTVSTLQITKSAREIQKGDNLIQSSEGLSSHYIPRSPPFKIKAKIISIFGGVDQAGQNAVITINKGRRDGLDNGHVLALYKESESSKYKGDTYPLPSQRYGLIFIFRTFEKLSYALVMEVQRTVTVRDSAETP